MSSRFSEGNQVVELLNPVAFLPPGTEPVCEVGTVPEQGLQSIIATSTRIPMGFAWPGFSGVLLNLESRSRANNQVEAPPGGSSWVFHPESTIPLLFKGLPSRGYW